MIYRNLIQDAQRILQHWNKMLFISGPRQVGKTVFAEQLRSSFGQSVYINWDVATDQKRFVKEPYFFEHDVTPSAEPALLIFDEIHKYRRWKSYLKGVYDQYHEAYRVIVTGSGRLDLYQKGGDSLLGRYMALPLFPFTIGELLGRRPAFRDLNQQKFLMHDSQKAARMHFDSLMRWSGFPEPLLRGEDTFYRIWSQSRTQRLIREDIRDATTLRHLSQMETLVRLLPPRLGSPLSINGLREELGVAFDTVKDWLEVLTQFYYLFRIPPYTGKLARSLKKETKAYLYDWGDIDSPGIRFENLVALHLLKGVSLWRSLGEAKTDLYYLRDREKREVDFVVTENNRPLLLVECKASDEELSPALLYYQQKLQVPIAIQLVATPGVHKQWHYLQATQWVISADQWLAFWP